MASVMFEKALEPTRPFELALREYACRAVPTPAAIALAERTFKDPDDLRSLAQLCAYDAQGESAEEITVVSVEYFATLLREPQISISLPSQFGSGAPIEALGVSAAGPEPQTESKNWVHRLSFIVATSAAALIGWVVIALF